MCLIIILITALFLPSSLYSKSFQETPHGDKSKLLKGCGSCHKGHGAFNTPLLSETKDKFCFRCHGSITNRNQARQNNEISPDVILSDIESSFKKTYHHPIEKTGIHSYRETLPENDPSMPRHAECVDCHHHHYANNENKFEGIKGVNPEGTLVPSILSEYELCFKCHSYSANLPSDQTNKADLFAASNPSYHPVIAEGKNNFMPSLIVPLTRSSIIQCTSCHNNDDSFGAKGPHGSNYRYILAKNFSDINGAEGVIQYELCYSCHVRTSILGNESFPFHNLHISTIGTSCRTCHNPHGSVQYPHLIDFDNMTISPSGSGIVDFRDTGTRSGECYLSCHGRDHDPGVYPSTGESPSRSNSLQYR